MLYSFKHLILGVTQDVASSKIDWIEAVKKDKIDQWLQVSDFKHIAKNTYNIGAIPSNFLIDPDGKIIAKDLRREEVPNFLKLIFRQ